MVSTKQTYPEELSFVNNYFILFQLKNLLKRVDLIYQRPKCPYSIRTALEFHFRVFFPLINLKVFSFAMKTYFKRKFNFLSNDLLLFV